MSFWSVARIQREALALHCLALNGYETYLPRLRAHRMVHGRRVELRPALFPGYAFVWIVAQQWYAARWSPGVLGLIMDGTSPARVPEAVITEIRRREVGGLIELARRGIRRGSRVIWQSITTANRATGSRCSSSCSAVPSAPRWRALMWSW
jgi:transcription antitermination factor NusG